VRIVLQEESLIYVVRCCHTSQKLSAGEIAILSQFLPISVQLFMYL